MTQEDYDAKGTRIFQINISESDRFGRILAGVVLVILDWLFTFPILFWLGIGLLLSAAFQFSLLYAIFRFSTHKTLPEKPAVPWEEFLDLYPAKIEDEKQETTSLDTVQVATLPMDEKSSAEIALEPARQPAKTKQPLSAKAVAAKHYQLPVELTQVLIQDIQKNALDEMLVVRFFENFFHCSISIQPSGHLQSYVCKYPDKTVSMNFAQLKQSLLQRLRENPSASK
jgi:hypothetical protein